MDANNQRPDWSSTATLWLTITAGAGLVLCARVFGPDVFYVTEREWRTAITAWWMVADGRGLFDAITPLLGPPWHIPMEFPLFQWLAANTPSPWLSLEDTGRVLSFTFFFISIFIVRRLALDLDLNRTVADNAALLFASSPIYLCYSLSFTIESLALLLALLHLWLFVRWLLCPGLVLLMATILAGCAAALVNVTTWAVFSAALSAIGAWSILSARRHNRSTGDALMGLVLVVGIPLACGAWWIQWSDTIKAGSGMMKGLTSEAMIRWAFGTLEQRLSLSQWGNFTLRSTLLVLGPVGLLASGPAMISFFKSRRARAPFPVLAASVTALVAGPMAFTNAYFEYENFILAIGIFAIILLTSTLFVLKPRRWLVVLILVSNLATTGFLVLGKQANHTDPLSDELVRYASLVPEDHTIVVLGSNLDSRVPYQAQRRALQTERNDPADSDFLNAIGTMKNQKVGAILTRSATDIPAARMAARILVLHTRVDLAPGVSVWTTPALKSKAEAQPLDLEAEASNRLIGFADYETPGRWGILLPSGPDAALGIGITRDGNIYLADIKRGIRVVHRRWSPEGRGG